MLTYQGRRFHASKGKQSLEETHDGEEMDSYLQRTEIRRKEECLVIYLNVGRKGQKVSPAKNTLHLIYIIGI